MRRSRASKRFRAMELALWVIGLLLVGVALEATWDRWSYQEEQEHALFEPALIDVRAEEETPRRELVTDFVGPAEPAGPRAPYLVEDTSQSAGPSGAPQLPESKPKKRPVDPSAFGRIEIPRLGVSAIVRKGGDEKTLDRAVGLIPGGAEPGQAGNVILAGHRDTFFRPLRKIRVNDRIRLVVPPGEYEYRVDSVRIVSPEETSVLASRGSEELTLVTCYPFYFVGPAPNRFIVSATPVHRGEPAQRAVVDAALR